jgi:ribonuclease D
MYRGGANRFDHAWKSAGTDRPMAGKGHSSSPRVCSRRKCVVERGRMDYNEYRHHSRSDGATSAGFAGLCQQAGYIRRMTDATMTERNTPREGAASSDTARPRMTNEQINAHPIRKYQGRIHVIRRSEQMEQAVRQLEKEKVLGFDTETRPTFRVGQRYPPAVLQLVGEHAAYVFQLRHCRLSKAICRLLANPKIIKAGVAWDRDVQELNKLASFTPAGFVDVGELAKQAGYSNHGLRGLATLLLGFRVSKSFQTSNWAQRTLTRAQIEYAATDAWVGRELYQKLQRP